MSKPYDFLLFDLDNTLLDFSASELDALRKASLEVGIELTDAHYQLYRDINKSCWTDFEHGRISKTDLRSIRFSQFLERCQIHPSGGPDFGRAYLTYLSESTHFISGAQDLLDDLSAHYRLVLITNGLTEVQRPRLRHTGLENYFEAIVISDEIGPAKPDPAFFDYTFEAIGHPLPSRCLVIGDNLHADIGGGLQYGTHAAWYNPAQKAADLDLKPTFELQQLEDLRDILQT